MQVGTGSRRPPVRGRRHKWSTHDRADSLEGRRHAVPARTGDGLEGEQASSLGSREMHEGRGGGLGGERGHGEKIGANLY